MGTTILTSIFYIVELWKLHETKVSVHVHVYIHCSIPSSSLPPRLSFLSNLESTQWLHYLCQLVSVACDVVKNVNDRGKPVLVHCSDGWDRTAQVVSLAELMLDPYYRTIEVYTCTCVWLYMYVKFIPELTVSLFHPHFLSCSPPFSPSLPLSLPPSLPPSLSLLYSSFLSLFPSLPANSLSPLPPPGVSGTHREGVAGIRSSIQ